MGPQVEQGECLSYGIVCEDREDKIDAARRMSRQELRLFLIVAALVVALDQITKLWIRASLSPGDQIAVLPGFVDLVLVKNYGAAFGLLAGHTALIISVSVVGLLLISAFLHHFPPANALGIVSFAMIMGGTTGNLVDRIRPPHYVTDFVRVHLLPTFSWPAFNVADAAMTVGIIALILYFYRTGLFRRIYGRSHRPGDREASA